MLLARDSQTIDLKITLELNLIFTIIKQIFILENIFFNILPLEFTSEGPWKFWKN